LQQEVLNMAKRNRKWGGKLLALTLTAALTLSMGSAAFAEVEAEPDWNEAGLRLQDYMEEYADCPETLAMLEGFLERNYDDLVGEMPAVAEEKEVVYTTGLADMPEPPMSVSKVAGLSAGVGIVPMNIPTFAALTHRVESDGTVTITGVASGFMLGSWAVIPSSIGGRAVRGIAANAFNRVGVSVVDIPASVTHIGANAFSDNVVLLTVMFRGTTPPQSIGANMVTASHEPRILVPFGTMESYRTRFASAGYNVSLTGTRNRIHGFCRNLIPQTAANHMWCTCCAFRYGDVDGNGSIAIGDALAVERYVKRLYPNVIQQSASAAVSINAHNAALATYASRRNGVPRQADADNIYRFVVGLCSMVGPQCRSTCSHCI
jgi:hypothetical protein